MGATVEQENEKSMHGWKTYTGAGLFILKAAYAGFVMHDVSGSLGFLALGMTAIGVRGAVAKVIAGLRGFSQS